LRAFRAYLEDNWPTVTITATAVVIACAAVVLLRSMPPRVIVMATGPEGGAYYELGKRYRAQLAVAHIEVRLMPTAGSVENLALLLDPHSKVSVALIQGGIVNAAAASDLESLGTVSYEPLWRFYRRDVKAGGLADVRGRKVAIGPEGSGTRALTLELLKRSGIELEATELLALEPKEAGEKLLAGNIDVAFMVASWDSPEVQRLLADERVAVSSYAHADAYVALYPFLNKVVVPRGARDLAKDQPPADLVLVAAKAGLVVRNDLHPATQLLLLNAALQIHSGPNIFQRANEFPAADSYNLPLSDEALRFYKSGPPFLHNYLPFWMAELTGKLIILLIPVLGVLYPMARFLPALYAWAMKRKISRLYGELRFLEDELEGCGTDDRVGEIAEQLERLEKQANHLRIPAAYASMLYMLRNHIELVRNRLNEERQQGDRMKRRVAGAKRPELKADNAMGSQTSLSGMGSR
jgi:TRAP transporter TAXI family solute receptor